MTNEVNKLRERMEQGARTDTSNFFDGPMDGAAYMFLFILLSMDVLVVWIILVLFSMLSFYLPIPFYICLIPRFIF